MSQSASRVAFIGGHDTVLPFSAVGVSVFTVSDPVAAKASLDEALKQGFGIIYIEEVYAREFSRFIAETNRTRRDVALTILPGSRGGSGIALESMAQLVKRAIGIDIFADK